MSTQVPWELLNVIVWTFGLRAALELRREFQPQARTWTTLVWAVANCLAMDLAMLGHGFTGLVGFEVVSVITGIVSGVLMWLTVRFLLVDLSTGREAVLDRAPDGVAILTGAGLLAVAAGLSWVPAAADALVGILRPVGGAVWISGSLAAILTLTRGRHSKADLAVFRPSALALAFGAALFHASLTPLTWLSGRTWPDGVGTLAGTMFILAMVTALYGTLLRVRGHRLADAERQLREAQEQLFSVEKLVAVGTLAAGAAHDFNNSLTVISGSAQLALDDPTLQGGARHDVEAVVRAASDAAQISANLLKLSRKHSKHHGAVSLEDAVMSPLRAIEKDLQKRGITVKTRCDEVVATDADPSVVAQVCLNLYLNARDAMETTGGGTLQVELHNAETGVEISVTDTGTGIPAWFLPRLFRPLQTTKGDKGTGLGLAGSKAMIESLGGRLTFETLEGRGTTFTVHLPAAPPLALSAAS